MPDTKETTVEENLHILFQLQYHDSKLDEIQILKGELPMEVSDLEDEITVLETRLANLENNIKDLEENKKASKRCHAGSININIEQMQCTSIDYCTRHESAFSNTIA